MVERQLPKLHTRVRFPSPAPFAVRAAKAIDKAYTLRDSLGLFFHATAKGGRAWHFRYYWAGKQWPISFGTYPEVPPQEARAMRDELT